MNDRKVDVLREIPLLSGCTEQELQTIAAIADMLRVRAGELVRDASGDDRSFYLVLSGAMAVGSEAVLVAGGWDGAVGLLGGEQETDELRMLTDGDVLIAGPREFSGMIATVPGFATAIGRDLTLRLREQHRRNFAA